MRPVEAITGLLILIVVLALVASRLRIAYPIAFVLGGALVALVPSVPEPQIHPDVVFFVFLPPLLFAAAWLIPWQGFRQNLRSISLLAVLPVLVTTAAVGLVTHWFIPTFPLAAALVMGAIVSPPDAVAATAITSRLGVPPRLSLVLEGESLLNDATGLTTLYFAQLAVVAGGVTLTMVGVSFLYVAVVGIVSGALVGVVMVMALRRIQDNALTMTLLLITPYCAYLSGQVLHSSGVLATVTAGLILARYSPDILSSSTRLEISSTLRTQVFILNGLVFVLVGAQMPRIFDTVIHHAHQYILGHVAILFTVVTVVRFAAVFPLLYLPPLLVPHIRRREGWPDWRHAFIVSWTGMRGVVSMAAALSIPLTVASGEPFPERDAIIFCTFAVIFLTLMVQGFSLPWLIRLFGIKDDGSEQLRLAEVRLRLAKAARDTVLGILASRPAEPGVEAMARTLIDNRLSYLQERYDLLSSGEDAPAEPTASRPWHAFHHLSLAAIKAERRELLRLNRTGEIDDDLRRKFDYELDLEILRLEGSRFA